MWSDESLRGGLFGSLGSMGAVSTITFPILWAFNKFSAIPSLLGIAFSKSSSCVLAFASALLFISPKKKSWYFLMAIPIVLLTLYFIEKPSPEWGFVKLTQLRFETWRVNELALTRNPFGIGFGPMAYQKAISSIPGLGAKSVLPHSGSDLLGIFLRLGVLSIPVVFFYAFKGLTTLKKVPLDASLLSIFILALIQTSISKPQVGFFAWVLWIVWLIERGKNGTIEKGC